MYNQQRGISVIEVYVCISILISVFLTIWSNRSMSNALILTKKKKNNFPYSGLQERINISFSSNYCLLDKCFTVCQHMCKIQFPQKLRNIFQYRLNSHQIKSFFFILPLFNTKRFNGSCGQGHIYIIGYFIKMFFLNLFGGVLKIINDDTFGHTK